MVYSRYAKFLKSVAKNRSENCAWRDDPKSIPVVHSACYAERSRVALTSTGVIVRDEGLQMGGESEKDKQLELQVSSSLRWQAFTARLQLQKKIPEPKNLALAPK